MSSGGVLFGRDAWDPVTIIAQIVAVQCLYYLSLALLFKLIVAPYVPALSLFHFFDWRWVSFSSFRGWMVSVATFTNALLAAVYLRLIVQRAKKCLDFAGTLMLLHLLAVTCFSGFPKRLPWWALHGTNVAVTALLGALQALDELRRLFAAPAGDIGTTLRLLALAVEVHNGLRSGAIQCTKELARKASSLATQLSRLDEVLCPLLSATQAPDASFANRPLRAQLSAACFTLSLAAGIVSSKETRPAASELQAVTDACKIVLRSGAALLEREAAELRSRGTAGHLLPGSAGPTEGKILAEAAAVQLAALVVCITVASSGGQLAQFTSRVAQPAELVRSLAAVARAFSTAGPAMLPVTAAAASSNVGPDCHNLYNVVVATLAGPALVASLQDSAAMADWAAAATAVLPLLPLLSQWHAQWAGNNRASAAEQQGPASLFGALFTNVVYNGRLVILEWLESGEAERPQPLPLVKQLFQLHSHTCRLLNAVVAGRCQMLLPAVASTRSWSALLDSLNLQYSLANKVLSTCQEQTPKQYARAHAASHITALTVAAAELGSQFVVQQDVTSLMHALMEACIAFPLVLQLGWLPLGQQAVQALHRGTPNDWVGRAEWLRQLCVMAAEQPQLGATLASSGLLELALAEARAMLASQDVDIMGECCFRVKHLRAVWYNAIDALLNAGGQLLHRLQADPATAGTAAVEQLQTAHAALDAANEGVYRGMPPQVRQLTLPVENLDSLSQTATALGVSMQQCWEQCGEAAQARVEIAQAAAARSCACLACCTFVGGGPAAGEGKGRKRCSGCHTAWYCSAECQQRAWKVEGHRQACKALAAARAARKQGS
ncbi:SYS1-like protein [Chlorella sorokiniana]|uniref:SYS1-like protein n=1 Tax=Chlorella sorokiniana TaxID=3076 RepID=A0A2P6TVT4_CHLSO|nr:SYS1-like protein [Chlorella sorokiniana]|eukprot:PRW58171.1 SYS1-like protein [Chlorella sorokiniana]